MSKTSRNDLKSYFLTGSAPTQGEFANLIESSLNSVDDKLTVISDGTERYFGIGTEDPKSPLSVKAKRENLALVSFEVEKDQPTWDIKLITSNDVIPGLNIGQNSGGDGQLFIRSGGNVGIGTTHPLTKLHVEDSTGACVILATNQEATAAIEQTNSDLLISNSSTTGKIIFGVGHDAHTKPSDSINPLVTINEQGNVGIGNNNPADRLQVEGGSIIVGSTEATSTNLLVAANGIQARVGDETQSLGLNVSGGNVGIGIDDPLAKVHIFDPTDQILLIEGLTQPTLKFAVKDKAPAEIGFKDEKTLSFNDTKLHIETTDDEAITIFSPGEPTIHLTIPDDDTETQDKLGFIKLTPEAFIIQSGPSDDPGIISLNGSVAFGTTNPESEFHIASENDDLLMLEGTEHPNLRFKNANGQVAEIVFAEGSEVSITAQEPAVLEKINLNGNVNVFSDSANTYLSVVSTEEIAGGEYTSFGIFLEALTNPILKFQGSEGKKAAIEFLNGNEIKFNNGDNGDLEKYTFHGNMDVKSSDSQTGFSVATDTESVEILANTAPGINLKSANSIASIQFNEGTLMLAGPQDMRLTGTHIALEGEANITENAIVKGDLQVEGSTALDSISIAGQVMTELIAKENIETMKDLVTQGNVEVKKQLNVTQKATLKGAAQVNGDTTLKKTLNVTGLTTTESDVKVGGKIECNNNLLVKGNANLKNALNVTGPSALEGGAVITGETSISGKLTLQDSLVTQKWMTVQGNCNLQKELSVSELATLQAGASITGEVNIDGKLNVENELTIQQWLLTKGNCTVKKDLNVAGNTSLEGPVTATDSLEIDGLAKLKSGLDVTGSTELRGKVEVKGALHSQKGVVRRDIFTQTIKTKGPISLTTNIKGADARIFRLLVEGCNSSTGSSVFSEVAGTSGASVKEFNHSSGVEISHDYDNNDRLVIHLNPELPASSTPDTEVDVFISISAWLPDAINLQINKN